ncbi:MAG: hydantoinase B/oxoprolinase family protein, partial [Chloroflexi bacterium]|nr:hydantoinase B/oxoprolinase family protein [Chloroflexota bacterium]
MLDPITLEVIWRRLISVVDEQAAALIHSSFTTVVREAGDLSAGLFDRAGNMVAQSVTGTPGHINTMANCVRKFIVPQHSIDSLQPGDTLITNDPWEASGHLFDLTIVSPVFYRGRGVAFFASTCHAVDIGGATMGGDARSVHEEGLAIPLMKLFKAGQANQELFDIIRANVRVPDQVIGDIHAQEVGNQVGARKLIELLEEYDLPDIEAVSAAILDKTEAAVRAAIRDLPDGSYRNSIQIDGFDAPLTIACEITVAGDEMRVDYAGSSPQVDRGINVVLNYTHAYTTYTLMAALAAGIPNNEGAFRPIHVSAPIGSILNCRRPAPVSARHLIGHFVSQPLLTALAQIMPQRVIANGSAGLWNTMMDGLDANGEEFAYIFFSAGGMGAAHDRDGLSATAFPSGIMGVPVEAIETAAPLLMHRREPVSFAHLTLP